MFLKLSAIRKEHGMMFINTRKKIIHHYIAHLQYYYLKKNKNTHTYTKGHLKKHKESYILMNPSDCKEFLSYMDFLIYTLLELV